MAARQNPERFLVPELEACILGDKLPDWPDGGGYEFIKPEWDYAGDELGGGGSNNWPGVALGCRYSTLFHERRFNPEKAVTRYLTISKTKFLGSEVDSSIYTWMVASAVLEIAAKARERGDSENRRLAMDWLRYLAARNLLFYDAGLKRILHVGERSAAHPKPGVETWQDAFLRTVMGWGQPPKNEKVLVKMRPLLLEVGAELRSGRSPIDLIRELGMRTLIPVRVAAWPTGKAVWMPGDSINGNTQAVKAAVWQDGKGASYAPKNRGYINDKDRTHRQKGRSSLLEVHEPNGQWSLSYASPVYDSLYLPIGSPEKRTLDLSIGGSDVIVDLRKTPAAVPPTPPTLAGELPQETPQPQSSWLSRLLRRIFG